MEGKVVLIGIDGATWDVIDPFIGNGKLPAFRRLKEEGAWGRLESTLPPISPSAWTSIFTGTNPGKHGIHGFVKRKEGSYFIRPISSEDRKTAPVWRFLSDDGKRCVLLNIPFSYPPDKVNGLMTTGLGTPSKDSDFAYPKEKRRELLERYPEYDVDFNEDLIFLGEGKDTIGTIKRITDAQARMARDLYEEGDWDLFAVVFRSIDVIQHYYWKDKGVMLGFYEQMDSFLGGMLEGLKDDETLLICSDHGFAEVHTLVNINNWLEGLDLFSIEKKDKEGSGTFSAEKVQSILLKLGLRNFVYRLKRSGLLEPVMKRFVKSERTRFLFDIRWRETKAYLVEGTFGMVNINLKGREPGGIVKEEDRDVIRDIIIEKALGIEDPSTGEMVITEALRGEDVYSGDDMPDVILVGREGYRLVGRYNRKGELFEKEGTRHGDHQRYGVFGAFGRNVRKGNVEGAQVYDITPTMMYILGLAPDAGMDGRVLTAAFDDGFIRERKDIAGTGSVKRTTVEKERIRKAVKRLKR